jgi:hypothetical protein
VVKRRERGKRLGSRLTGISTPFGGASWEPATADVDVAQRVLAFLEDRRALYSPSEMEIAEHVVQSVIEIRRFLTEVLGDGGVTQELAGSLRAMRGACRAFLDESHVEQQGGLYVPESIHRGYYRNGLEDWQMNQALGKMRGLFGVHIALVADR